MNEAFTNIHKLEIADDFKASVLHFMKQLPKTLEEPEVTVKGDYVKFHWARCRISVEVWRDNLLSWEYKVQKTGNFQRFGANTVWNATRQIPEHLGRLLK